MCFVAYDHQVCCSVMVSGGYFVGSTFSGRKGVFMRKVSRNELIRKALGHGVGVCRVRITRSGEVHRYGSSDPYKQHNPSWVYVGELDFVIRRLAEEDEANANNPK